MEWDCLQGKHARWCVACTTLQQSQRAMRACTSRSTHAQSDDARRVARKIRESRSVAAHTAGCSCPSWCDHVGGSQKAVILSDAVGGPRAQGEHVKPRTFMKVRAQLRRNACDRTHEGAYIGAVCFWLATQDGLTCGGWGDLLDMLESRRTATCSLART